MGRASHRFVFYTILPHYWDFCITSKFVYNHTLNIRAYNASDTNQLKLAYATQAGNCTVNPRCNNRADEVYSVLGSKSGVDNCSSSRLALTNRRNYRRSQGSESYYAIHLDFPKSLLVFRTEYNSISGLPLLFNLQNSCLIIPKKK